MMKKLGLLLMLTSIFGGAAWAQVSTGSIRGDVTDAEGQPVPGVQVTVSSPNLIHPRSATTGAQGEFNIPALPVGTYTAEARLQGFATAKAEGVRVLLGAAASVKLQLRLEGVEAAVEVTSTEAPVVDPTDTSTGGRVTYEELVKVPTARDPWAVLSMVPGIQSDRVNVGGTQSGQQAVFAGKGDDGTNTVWSIDGINITDPASAGASATYYDFGTLEELQVSTGGNAVSQLTGGIGINIVTKRGSNELHGSDRATFTNKSLQQDNITDEIENASGDPEDPFKSPKVHQILEFGGELGGPILKDRLWFWGSGSRNKIEQRTITDDPDVTTLINYAGKLNVQVTEQNEANVFFNYNNKQKQGRNAAPDRPPKTTWNQDTPTPLFKLEDQQLFGSDTLLAGKFAHVGGHFFLHPQGGGKATGDANPPMAALDDLTGNWDDKNFVTSESFSSQTMFHLDGSHYHSFGGTDHDFKFGFSYRHTPVESHSYWDGGGFVLYNLLEAGDASDYDTMVVINADETFAYVADTASAYLSDTMTAGRLTVDAGLRFDRQTSRNTDSTRAENPLAPEVFSELKFSGDDEASIAWNFVSPRVGLTYQAGEKLLLRTNYAYYADQLAGRQSLLTNPVPGYQYFYAYFDDVNADHTAQKNELVYTDGAPCNGLCQYVTGFDPEDPNRVSNQIDPNLKTPKTHELILGATYQLAKDAAVGVTFTARQRVDDTWNLPLVIDASGQRRPLKFSDWVEIPTSEEFQGAGTPGGDYAGNFQLPAYTVRGYTLKDGLALDSGAVILTNRPDYTQRYLGVELMFQKAFGEGFNLSGSVSLNDWTEHFTVGGEGDVNPNRTESNPGVDGGPVAPQSQGSGAFGDVFINTRWQGNLRGTYVIPKVNVDLGASFTLRQGYPSPFTHRATTDIPGDGSSSTNLLIGGLEDYRMQNVADLDLRVGKEFAVTSRASLEVSLDAFNVFNASTLLQHRRVASRDNFLQPTEILGPRLFRLSMHAKF